MIPSYKQYSNWSLPSKVTYISFILGLIGIILTMITIYTDNNNLTESQIIEFSPKIPKNTKRGKCWINSFSVERPNAWRCSVKNSIYDPCFEIINLEKDRSKATVICNAYPTDESKSFLLKLEEPLPQRKTNLNILGKITPKDIWYMELENGNLCYVNTGVTTTIFGNRLNYECTTSLDSEYMWLIGNPRMGKIWTSMALRTDQNHKILSNDIVNIKTIYR